MTSFSKKRFLSLVNKIENYISKSDFRFIAFSIIVLSIFFALITLTLFLLKTTELSYKLPINTSIFADYGSVVGGIVAAILSLASVLLLIQTINHQIKENKIQNIESRFFELLRLHRENVSEFNSKGRTGKRVIIDIFDEFQELYFFVLEHYPTTREGKLIISRHREVVEVAYYITFFGIGNNSFRELERRIKQVLRNDSFYLDEFKPRVIEKLIYDHKKVKDMNQVTPSRSSRNYVDHGGHQSRLGHYYRHLFQAINYINKISPDLISYQERYAYVKTLRAQLSNHEQALLFINSLTSLGIKWEKHSNETEVGLITKYNLIKNIPLGFIQDLEPRSYYPFVDYEFLDNKTITRIYIEKKYI